MAYLWGPKRTEYIDPNGPTVAYCSHDIQPGVEGQVLPQRDSRKVSMMLLGSRKLEDNGEDTAYEGDDSDASDADEATDSATNNRRGCG